MKSVSLLFLLGILISCASLKSEYGIVKVDETDAISVAELVTRMDKSKEPQTVTIKSPLSAVCQNAGCWVQVPIPDGKPLMVRFKNHFTIPPATPLGTESYIHGVAYWDKDAPSFCGGCREITRGNKQDYPTRIQVEFRRRRN
jgi:hypothetical protein